ncbi:MAG: restriction endonuclease [Terriglobales bacterium]
MGVAVIEDQGLPSSAPWGPHVYVPAAKQAWHVLTEPPSSTAWLERMRVAAKGVQSLRLGVAGSLEILNKPEIIKALDELRCAVLPVQETDDGYRSLGLRASIADVIYEHRLVLESELVKLLLDRCLDRAGRSKGSYAKGATLELLVALMLSQVTGFEVTDTNILSANQEIDVHVTNRNSAGPLGRGQYVLAEAKNWKNPVPRKEYDAFAKKMRTRHGMAKLGVMVTTNTFEAGVYVEAIRDSQYDDVIVLLDKTSLPKLWTDFPDVTRGLEDAIKRAVYDHEA